MNKNPLTPDLLKRIEELETRENAINAFGLLQRENDDIFKAIIENVPIMIDAFDIQGKGILWNRESAKVLGWEKEDIFNSADPLSLLYPDPLVRNRVLSDKTLADGIFREYRVTTKAGVVRTQLWANFRLPNGAVISVGEDITQTKQAIESLKRSEQHFRDLVENSLTGISIIQNERVVYRNPEQQRSFGPVPADGFPVFYDRVHPEDQEKAAEIYHSTMAGNTSSPGVVIRFIYLAGETSGELAMKWLHCRASLIDYRGAKAVLINMMDVTKAREVQRLHDIKDRMISLGHMTAGIAHEIRNPLSGINIYLDSGQKILERGGDIEQLKMVLSKVQAASLKIESVIKRVLDFSKPSEPNLVPIDIRNPIEEALALSSVTLRKTGIIIRTNLADDLPACIVDAQLIEQVLLNLITNAAEAMKNMEKGKVIEVEASCTESSIKVSVADSGPGMPAGVQRKVFDPFFTTKESSTGIGLSLSQRIIHDHGGTLTASTGPLGGAVFSFTVPVQQRRQE